MSGSGREALQDVRELSEDHPGCLGVVGKPYTMSVIGWEAPPDVGEWSRGSPGCPR